MLGTIPYLGFYLHDLTYIDSARDNHISMSKTRGPTAERLINFEKQRTNFEVLARIKLFQLTIGSYSHFLPVPQFQHWFDQVRIFTEDEK